MIRLADRYIVSHMVPRMVAALAVTLVALLIERLLRLLDFLTGHGADLGPMVRLVLNLLPHYLGLALPAAFCIAIISALSAMSKSSELDALEAAGWSVRRIGAPFIACSVAFAILSALLFGLIQPYSRYAFSEISYAIASAGWQGRVEQGVFLDLGEGMTLSAMEIDATGRQLSGVFFLREDETGETAITAREGIVVPDEDAQAVYLVLRDGQGVTSEGQEIAFEDMRVAREFDGANNPFRPRGDSVRELTFFELWRELHDPLTQASTPPELTAEFHERIIRALSLIGVALIAVPLSVSRKRAPGWLRIGIAVVILAVYDNSIKLVTGMATLGQVPPVPAIWGLFGAFFALGLWLYFSTAGQGGRSPFRSLLRFFSELRGA
ncbi:MAG: LptF/LptG family permease [Pseudomonadota bacterium]